MIEGNFSRLFGRQFRPAGGGFLGDFTALLGGKRLRPGRAALQPTLASRGDSGGVARMLNRCALRRGFARRRVHDGGELIQVAGAARA